LQLDLEIEQYNEARERELPLVQELEAKVKELRQNIAGLNNHQMSLRATFRKLKEKNEEMDEKVRLWKMNSINPFFYDECIAKI
jgi:kinetochore protein Nuf2